MTEAFSSAFLTRLPYRWQPITVITQFYQEELRKNATMTYKAILD